MNGLRVLQPGLLTLIQDGGRLGQHRIGLTTGGPLDPFAFNWANRLCDNASDATALEISIGGLSLEAQVHTRVALCGGEMTLKINGHELERWHAHRVQPGDKIDVGYSKAGARAYLAVSGGFEITPQFGSTATVTREGIGGLNGSKLQQGDQLPCADRPAAQGYRLPQLYQPDYHRHWPLRVIVGYQQEAFSSLQLRRFFSSEYQVSDRADRMGYRLEGPSIAPSINGILSEGICLGAIQVPADGQPIVLLNDRQTIGGYPKLGSMFSLDTARLAQLLPGASVTFEEISQDYAHNHLHLARQYYHRVLAVPV